MSWLDRINNIKLTITTGDGSVFEPLYMNPSYSRDMSASIFNFNNIKGSLVKRGEAESRKFPVTLYFQGEDNLDEAKRFDIASLDSRPMVFAHPKYGDLLLQPTKLNFDDDKENVTVVTGQFYETIEDTYPDSSISVKEDVLDGVENAISIGVENFGISSPSPVLVNTISRNLTDVSESYKSKAITDIDLQTVQDASNEAISALSNIINDPITFMDKMAVLLRAPSRFYARVQDRIGILKESYEDLKTAIGVNSTSQEKLYFEVSGSALLSSMSESSVIQTQEIADDQQIEDNLLIDYNTRTDVILVVDELSNELNDYFNTIGDNQSEVDADPESYTPKQNGANAVKEAVNKASGQLIQISVETKQERIYDIPNPIGIVQLVHRLLGTTESNAIQQFVENNNILLSEYIQIRPPRKVTYHV